MAAPSIAIDFCDWGLSCPKDELHIARFLRKTFPVYLAERPDFLFYSHTGHHHRLYGCVRVFITSESDRAPDWSVCDYALTPHYSDHPRHLRFPPYALLFDPDALVSRPGDADAFFAQKTKFCSFLSSYRNSKTRLRWDFFEKLSQYKKVDSAGGASNNVGFRVPYGIANTVDFLRSYKFNMAFENKQSPGYISEKLLLAFAARCIPIYFGDPRVAEEFNPKRFLNYHDFPSEDALIARIREIDANDDIYRQILAEPIFHGNKPNTLFEPDYYVKFFNSVFTSNMTPAAIKHQQGWRKIFGRWTLAKADKPLK